MKLLIIKKKVVIQVVESGERAIFYCVSLVGSEQFCELLLAKSAYDFIDVDEFFSNPLLVVVYNPSSANDDAFVVSFFRFFTK